MGNASSKQAKHLKKLGKQLPKQPSGPTTLNQAQHEASIRNEQHTESQDYLDRVKSLGAVKFEPMADKHVKPDNEIIGTLKAREKMYEEANKAAEERQQNATTVRNKVHPATISSILQSIKDGDSPERIAQDYKITSDFLERLGSRYTIPTPLPPGDIGTQEIRSMSQPVHKHKPAEGEVREPKKFPEKTVKI